MSIVGRIRVIADSWYWVTRADIKRRQWAREQQTARTLADANQDDPRLADAMRVYSHTGENAR